MSEMRIQKFLSHAGYCSRRKGEEYILGGKVRVNGEVVKNPGAKIHPEKDRVEIDEKVVRSKEDHVYIILNKPVGYVSSTRQKGARVVTDLVKVKERIYPVGRLDKDSTGLLLLTNDGRLHHLLSHPSFDHEKEYEVSLVDSISDEALEKMAWGMMISGKITRKARVRRISRRRFSIILQEGRNRQIRKMVEELGGKVKTLHRIRISGIYLHDLPLGHWRHLNKKEKNILLTHISREREKKANASLP